MNQLESEIKVVREGNALRVKPNSNSAKAQAKSALQDYDTALAALTDNWAGLNANQKVEAVRAGVVILMKAVRFLMLRAAK